MSGQHLYRVIAEYDDGTWDCLCPVCGRRIWIRFEPFEKQVKVKGDEYAEHSASQGGLTIGAEVLADKSLGDWEEGLQRMGFDALWDL